MKYSKIALVSDIAGRLTSEGWILARSSPSHCKYAASLVEDLVGVTEREGWCREYYDALVEGRASEDMDPSRYGSSDWGHLIDDCVLVEAYLLTGRAWGDPRLARRIS